MCLSAIRQPPIRYAHTAEARLFAPHHLSLCLNQAWLGVGVLTADENRLQLFAPKQPRGG